MESERVVVQGPASVGSALAIATAGGWPLIGTSCRQFADGELCVQLNLDEDTGEGQGPLTGKHVVVVQGTQPPQHDNLMVLAQLVDAVRSFAPTRITCVVPYLAYGRQDRVFTPGQPSSHELVLKMLVAAGCDDLLSLDIHALRVFNHLPINVRSVPAARLLARRIAALGLPDMVVLAPDLGGKARAYSAAKELGVDVVLAEKSKDHSGATTYDAAQLPVEGRSVIIIDDLASSGSTLVPLAELIRRSGAAHVAVGLTHLLIERELLASRLGLPVNRIIVTDSVPLGDQRESTASLFLNWLRETDRP